MSKEELKEWEKIQERVFTKWVNAQLGKRGRKINNLFTDFEDGIQLIHLYEVISDTDLGSYNKAPKFDIHKVANLNKVISLINKFVDSVGIKVQFSAEQVLKGEKRIILGMIWCLIHKFEIQNISEEEYSAREGLLLWCQKKTKGYPRVNVKNFTSSWQDGLAFCALIHKHRPDLINYDECLKQGAKENLQTAFDVAEKHLDIPQLLDVNDMLTAPDDKSVMTYIAYYWKKFAAGNKEKKAARKVGRVAKNQKDNEKLMHDYEERAKKLKQWIAENDEKLQNTSDFGNNLDEVQKKNAEFKQFAKVEKPQKAVEKADLEVLLTNLRSKQKNEHVPIYTPPKELSTEAIQEAWNELEKKQEIYDAALREAIKRMKYLEMLLERFRSRSKKILGWQEEKAEFLSQEVPNDISLANIRALVKMHEAFVEEKKSVNASLESTNQIGKEIVESGHSAAQEVSDTMNKMKEGDEKIEQDSKVLSDRLNELLKLKQELEDNCLEFAKKGEQLNLFLEEADLTLTEPVQASNVKDVDEAIERTSAIAKEHESKKALYEELNELSKKILDAGGNPKVYSRHDIDSLTKKFNSIGEKLASKLNELSVEKNKQEEHARLLDEYTKAVDEYKKFAEEQFKLIAHIYEGEPEDQLKQVEEVGKTAVSKSAESIKELQALYQKLEENDIAEKASTAFQELDLLDQQIKNTLSKRLKAIEQDIYAKKMQNVSEEQLKEFHETFRYFDKGKNGKLNKHEFKAACASVGEDIPDNELDKVFKTYDRDEDGFISFEEFVHFMSSIVKEGTSYEDVIQSFKELAGGNDFITENQLRAALDNEEADYLIASMPRTPDGNLDYIAYAKKTYGVE